MTELPAKAGSEGYAACDDEASVELSAKRRTTEAQSVAQVSIGRREPTKRRMHFVGEEEQRND